MSLSKEKELFLKHKAYDIRHWSLKATTQAGSGHPTSALSAADMLAVLFFDTMRYNPKDFTNPNNDRFILSKGHASPGFYATYHALGILSDEDMMHYRHFESPLEGHPTFRFDYTEAATGALGLGLSIGAGQALAARMDKKDYRTYVLLGDSEMTEGCVWEAIQIAGYYKLNNLIGIIDVNRLGQTTETIEGHDLKQYEKMIAPFGWHTIAVDGHSITDLKKALDDAKKVKDKPVMIVAKTIKGYGVEKAEGELGFHGKAFSEEELDNILEDLKKRFNEAAAYTGGYVWEPDIPKKEKQAVPVPEHSKLPQPPYKKDDEVATRVAFGQSLAALGGALKRLVSLDAEVKNSTYAELFEKEYPDRFVQCFIAEQNMVSMGVGFDRRDFIPFCSTFGAFLSRAHDQIRMAAIGQARLRLVGSHAGVSIGEDGPSQMGLEDIAMMRCIPDSIVLYPSDGVSAFKCVQEMARYEKGISYLRTTRMKTPVIYDNKEEFPIGGLKLLKESDNDQVCVIGAGVTLHNALKAYEQLQGEKIDIAVIDLYCVKPLDIATLLHIGSKSGNKIITVEDHYLQGGIGEAVAAALCNTNIEVWPLAVTKLPRSGTPDELMAYEGIDADAIIKTVKEMIAPR